MRNEPAFLFAELAQVDAWEQEEKPSYDAATLDDEYRARLYSEKGRELLKSLERELPVTVCTQSR
jgi:hypothetical protein